MTKKVTTKETATPEVVDQGMIDEAVAFINEKAEETIYKGSIEIGEYILKTFFNDDIELASSKNPKKQTSFNALCERPDLSINPTRLAQMVRVASQERYLLKEKVSVEALSYTHKAAFAKLNNGVKKKNMIKKCIDNKWTTRQLDDEVKKELTRLAVKPNPSLIQTTRKYITKVDDVLATVDDSTLDVDDDALFKMSDKKRKDLEIHLKDLKKKVKVAAQRTDAISSGCDGLLAKLKEVEEERKKNPPKRGRQPKSKTK